MQCMPSDIQRVWYGTDEDPWNGAEVGNAGCVELLIGFGRSSGSGDGAVGVLCELKEVK